MVMPPPRAEPPTRDRRLCRVALALMQLDVERRWTNSKTLLADLPSTTARSRPAQNCRATALESTTARASSSAARLPQGGNDGADHVEAQCIDRRTIENDVRYALGNRIARQRPT